MSELTWVKSSYSDSGGGDCVEVAVDWHKSSYSDASGGACVEVATAFAAVHVRDSKRIGGGPVLCLSPRTWDRFLGSVQGSGER